MGWILRLEALTLGCCWAIIGNEFFSNRLLSVQEAGARTLPFSCPHYQMLHVCCFRRSVGSCYLTALHRSSNFTTTDRKLQQNCQIAG
jgi:hypothetical protein